MQVAHRLDVGAGGIDGVGHRAGVQFRSGERGRIEPQRPVGDAAKAERDLEATPLLVEAETNAKSERRALISKKPVPMR